MGDRSRIIVKSESFANPIHLYGHWAGTDNLSAVATVLSKTDRVGDPSYLTAQLFYDFAVFQNSYDGNLGFGISVVNDDNGEYDDNSPIIIFADNGDVAYQDYFYTKEEFLEKFGVSV
jgi:hypothetical protein